MAKDLTKRQRFWLAHVRSAVGSSEPLHQYAKKHRLSLGALYNAKSVLKRRGALNVIVKHSRQPLQPAFVPVRMSIKADELIRCQLQHAQWRLEMERLPDPKWLRALMCSEDGDAAA